MKNVTGTCSGEGTESTEFAPLAISAEQPDAAPQRGDDATRVVFHVIALAALVVLLAYCIVWAPRARKGQVDRSAAAVTPVNGLELAKGVA